MEHEECHKREKKKHYLISKRHFSPIQQIPTFQVSAQKLTKLTCRSILKRNKSSTSHNRHLWQENKLDNVYHDLQHQHRQRPSLWIRMLENFSVKRNLMIFQTISFIYWPNHLLNRTGMTTISQTVQI